MHNMTPAPYEGLNLQYIDGTWRSGTSGKTAVDVNPYSGAPLVEIPLAGKEDMEAAMRAARTAQPAWELTPASERAAVAYRLADIFVRRKKEIISWLVAESGSTVIKSAIEWGIARQIVLEAASYPTRLHGRLLAADVSGKESRIYRRPVGVVAVISPWNFPLHLSIRSIITALTLGNAVVHKPASDTPVTGGLLIAKMLEEAGLSPGLFNVLAGSGGDIGDAFARHPIPRFITFTGSTAVGKRLGALVAEAPVLKRMALELGGNSPFVVLDDADLETAVNAAIFGKFLHQGQICMAINRIIVDEALYRPFVDKFTERASRLRCGDPSDPGTAVGPLINGQQKAKLTAIIAGAKAAGARQTLDGRFEGLLLTPHVFADVDPASSLAVEETFGPVSCIIKAANEAHALEMVNASTYGLSSAVFTGDPERGARFARKVAAGMTHVNDTPVADLANAPFGGEKNSGIGRFNGDWLLEEMTTPQWITVQDKPGRYPF